MKQSVPSFNQLFFTTQPPQQQSQKKPKSTKKRGGGRRKKEITTRKTNGIVIEPKQLNAQYVNGMHSLDSTNELIVKDMRKERDRFLLNYELSALKSSNYSDWLRLNIKRELRELKDIHASNSFNVILNNPQRFPTLWELHVGTEILYPTSVLCESAFSLMKNVKTRQRASMKDETLESIMRIKYATLNDINSSMNALVNHK